MQQVTLLRSHFSSLSFTQRLFSCITLGISWGITQIALSTGVALAQSDDFPPLQLPYLDLTQLTQRNFTCNTDAYSAYIQWQAGKPGLTFGRSSSRPDLRNVPVQQSTTAAITTFTTSGGETKTQVFVYQDGTCAVTVTSTAGEATVNELGQLAFEGGVTLVPPPTTDTTVLTFQTRNNAVRIYTRNGQMLINVYDKQDKVTWLNGVPVTAERTPEGMRYVNQRGESRIEVFDASNGDAPMLTIDGAIDR